MGGVAPSQLDRPLRGDQRHARDLVFRELHEVLGLFGALCLRPIDGKDVRGDRGHHHREDECGARVHSARLCM
jgi:hypothetical protein